jgi:hypothetical protein
VSRQALKGSLTASEDGFVSRAWLERWPKSKSLAHVFWSKVFAEFVFEKWGVVQRMQRISTALLDADEMLLRDGDWDGAKESETPQRPDKLNTRAKAL